MHYKDVDARHKAGHDEIKPSTTSGANLILPSTIRTADRRGKAACDVDLATARTGTFARAG